MMSKIVTVAFSLQLFSVTGSFLSRAPDDISKDVNKLPEVKDVVAKPAEVLNSLRTGVGELVERLNAAENITKNAVSKKKEEFEMQLKNQKQQIGAIGMTNAVILQRINDLRTSSENLRLKATQLLKENRELRQDMLLLKANMTTAQDFSDLALNSAKMKIDNATELKVLRQLDEEDAARTENASRYRRLQEINAVSKKMVMLEFGAGPSSSPQEMLQSLLSSLTSLEDAENASLMSLQAKFDEQFQEGVKKYQQLLADQGKLNSTWASESEINSRLVVAVNHLKDTQVQVRRDLESVRQYVQKLVGLSSGQTGVFTSPASADVTKTSAVEKFHASKKAAVAEKQEQNAKSVAAFRALARRKYRHASVSSKESKAEVAKEAIGKALAHEKPKKMATDDGKKTQDIAKDTCHATCYSDHHKDVPWNSHKCLWKNCHECAECANDAGRQTILAKSDADKIEATASAQHVHALRQKTAGSAVHDVKVKATSNTEAHANAEHHGEMSTVTSATAKKRSFDAKKKMLAKLDANDAGKEMKEILATVHTEETVHNRNKALLPKTATANSKEKAQKKAAVSSRSHVTGTKSKFAAKDVKAASSTSATKGANVEAAERKAKRKAARAERKAKETQHPTTRKVATEAQNKEMEVKEPKSTQKKQLKMANKAAEKPTKSEKASETHQPKHVKSISSIKRTSVADAKGVEKPARSEKASETHQPKRVKETPSIKKSSAVDAKGVEKPAKSEKASETHQPKRVKETPSIKKTSQTVKAFQESHTAKSKHVEKPTSTETTSENSRAVPESSKTSWVSWLMR